MSTEREFTAYVTGQLPRLRAIALGLCGDAHRADDVVQVAITRLYLHWWRARRAGDLDAYCRRIVVRTFLNEQRRRWAAVRLVGGPAELPQAAGERPDVETRQVLRAALDRLPPKQRAVLVLRFLSDLPVAEVARAVGCSEASVKGQTRHGLRRLRDLLGARVPEWTEVHR
ncbi:SigE family RNA polymerase sigma factor [Amycolatopsis suaedae]|uniref:SigE family RNA polymerase sigma factor n=1 Tax=Amycolatopsis suaedae TaxID=2510978 RepID=A0A4Q7J3Z7_9PSEU|nr:SigE family RNA polymerase sigma factor [Amycolatopsis suaedae]RZQ61518.1 SigE family RNA polymerase sigma factor [Amycolatopsis suaedae]